MYTRTVLIALAAGAACSACTANAADQTAHHIEESYIPASQIGSVQHVYYNIGTGERIVSSVAQGQTVAADAGSSSSLIWSVGSGVHQCEGINGHTGISALGFGDDIDGTEPWSVGGTWSSMGDISSDTVVDCVGFNYWTAAPDVDLDKDGAADGIPGLGIVLDWWDADNGFASNVSTRVPLIELTFGGLQGGLDLAPGFFAGYIFTVDLTADNLGVDLTMEIGDSDGDSQGAGVSNADGGNGYPIGELGHDFDLDGNDDADIDGNGFFDWTMGMRFIQPSTFDFDGDGVIDGDVADQADTAISVGQPAGHTLVQNDKGIWEWEIDLAAPAVATGAEMYTAIYLPPDPVTGDIVHSGFFANFSGFDDDGNPNPPSCDKGSGYIPTATIAHSLYSSYDPNPCTPDIDGSNTLDFFDVSQFLSDFGNGDDYNGDGLTDFFDVSDFLNDFGLGCPFL